MVVAYQREDAPSSCVGKKKHSWKVGDHMPPLGVLVAIFYICRTTAFLDF